MKKSILVKFVVSILFVYLGTMSGYANADNQNNGVENWQKFITKFTLRNETIEVSLHYPGSWFVEEKPEAYQVSFQNVPFLNNLNELGQELPLTIEKITFMLDPKPTSDIDWKRRSDW